MAYVADCIGLQVIDVAKPQTLVSYDTLGEAIDVAVVGATAYVVVPWSGLRVIDVSTPSKPKLLGSYDTPGITGGVTVVGTMAYLVHPDGLRVIDVSTPSKPKLRGDSHRVTDAWNVAVVGTTAYVAGGKFGLQVIDVSKPSKPKYLSSYSSNAVYVVVVGTTAYVADVGSGLQVIDVSTPSKPQLLGSYDIPGGAYGVAVEGTTAYVVVPRRGLWVIDVSTPSKPLLLGICDMYGGWNVGWPVYVQARVPNFPRLRGAVNFDVCDGWAVHVAVVDTTVYVTDGGYLHAIDVSTPSKPQLLCIYNTPGFTYGFAIVGTTAYVADVWGGLQVIDVSTQLKPMPR
ncbi:MAG: repeat-containing protein [Candidatus Brocadiaceae bacterium]|nr:repeat-containing protein [Candidatus Brocadiaceae bacterium]